MKDTDIKAATMKLGELIEALESLDPIKDKELCEEYQKQYNAITEEIHEQLARNGVPL